jgi:ketosteroid isomerase-like protein
MRRTTTAILLISILLLALVNDTLAKPRPDKTRIDATLTALHEAASKADGKAYFALFAPDAVFLGTDATERWTIDEFKAYANTRFETGTGWTYTLREGTRHIVVAGDVAWFDELLDNAKYGTCRGSGVLRKIDGAWKIAQYNLTFTVPNEVAADVVNVIRKAHGEQD